MQSCYLIRLGLHAWGKWSAPIQKDFMERMWTENDNVPPEWKLRKMTIQDRTCQCCGLYQYRQVRLTQEIHV